MEQPKEEGIVKLIIVGILLKSRIYHRAAFELSRSLISLFCRLIATTLDSTKSLLFTRLKVGSCWVFPLCLDGAFRLLLGLLFISSFHRKEDLTLSFRLSRTTCFGTIHSDRNQIAKEELKDKFNRLSGRTRRLFCCLGRTFYF